MTTNVNKCFFCFLFLILPLTNCLYAQIVIGNPSLGFSQICANSSFNSFYVTFTFSPEAQLTATNQFIVELSDANGSFTSATSVFTSSPGAVTTSPATLNFSVPTTTSGEKYKLRIKSTSPVATSSNSVPFAAYYKFQDSPFSINNFVSTASYCSGGDYVLTIDNPGTGSNDSPLKYPSLTYNWFKETTSTPVLVSTGSSLTVSQPGIYYVETNYGTCTSNSYSNRVTVNEANSSGSATISSSLGNPFCSGTGSTTLSTNRGNSYQWYKDNAAIPGANSQTYVTNQSGNYSVAINFGSCSASASIDLKNYDFESSINVPSVNSIAEGEILKVTVTTTASNPDYKWYLNGSLIPGATTDTYDVTNSGSYKVVITQTTGCISSNEIPFVARSGTVNQIPNIISLSSSYPFNVWDIPNEYKNPKTRVQIISSIGVTALDTYDYQSDWPASGASDFKNINPVYYYIISSDNEIKKGSITIIK